MVFKVAEIWFLAIQGGQKWFLKEVDWLTKCLDVYTAYTGKFATFFPIKIASAQKKLPVPLQLQESDLTADRFVCPTGT